MVVEFEGHVSPLLLEETNKHRYMIMISFRKEDISREVDFPRVIPYDAVYLA